MFNTRCFDIQSCHCLCKPTARRHRTTGPCRRAETGQPPKTTRTTATGHNTEPQPPRLRYARNTPATQHTPAAIQTAKRKHTQDHHLQSQIQQKKTSRPAATVRSLQPLQNNDLESAAQPARQAARAPRPPTRTPHPAGRLTGWQGTGRRQRRTRLASRVTPCYQPRYYLTSGPPPPRPPLDLQGLPPPPPTPPSYSTPPPPTLDPLTFLRSTFTITCPPQGGHLTTLELALHHVPLPERGGDATRAPVGLPMALLYFLNGRDGTVPK